MLARTVTAPVSQICLGLATLTFAAPIEAMPDRAWRGAERVVVLCSVDAGNELGHAEIARDLCERIVRIAAPAAPMPIEIVGFGSTSLNAPGSAALLVHASLLPASAAVPGARGKLISWTMRTTVAKPSDGLAADQPSLFGAPPRIAALGGEGLDRALRASLGDVLPWLRNG